MDQLEGLNPESFLGLEQIHKLSIVDRFVALLWWYSHQGRKTVEFQSLVADCVNAGYPSINVSRERKKLRRDRRTTSANEGKSFSIQIRATKDLNEQYISLVKNRPLPNSSTLFDEEFFSNTRGYIRKVIRQINLSYDYQLYDCCAVMLRRLLETLIIELYTNAKRHEELKKDGNFMMFSGLLLFLENDKSITIGRQTMTALKDFKALADSSAHNPAYNATKKHIDDVIVGVKLGVVELKQRAFDNT
jgi:hypothetical protein